MRHFAVKPHDVAAVTDTHSFNCEDEDKVNTVIFLMEQKRYLYKKKTREKMLY